jgi:hypothetical protein
MSYGKLNIWLRDINCCPKNFWKVQLVIKTCTGKYLVDFNPDVVEKLAEAYPAYTVELGKRDGEITIDFRYPRIKHLEVAVPPGCYKVRAWVCSDNLWSHTAMAIVDCGAHVCVNLLVPPKEGCMREVLIPAMKAGYDFHFDPAELRPVVNGLLKLGQIDGEAFRRDVADLTDELAQIDEEEAQEYAEALRYMREAM